MVKFVLTFLFFLFTLYSSWSFLNFPPHKLLRLYIFGRMNMIKKEKCSWFELNILPHEPEKTQLIHLLFTQTMLILKQAESVNLQSFRSVNFLDDNKFPRVDVSNSVHVIHQILRRLLASHIAISPSFCLRGDFYLKNGSSRIVLFFMLKVLHVDLQDVVACEVFLVACKVTFKLCVFESDCLISSYIALLTLGKPLKDDNLELFLS